jgi:hypothetical protein
METRYFDVSDMTIPLFRELAKDAVANCFAQHGWRLLMLKERPTLDDLLSPGGEKRSFWMLDPLDDAAQAVYYVIEIGESLQLGEHYDAPATRLKIIAVQTKVNRVRVQVEYHDWEPFGAYFVRWLLDWLNAVELSDSSAPAVAPSAQAGAVESSTPANDWEREAWYQELTLNERINYDFLRPHKEDWEQGRVTDGELAKKAQKTAKTIREWRSKLRDHGAPDMEWKKKGR